MAKSNVLTKLSVQKDNVGHADMFLLTTIVDDGKDGFDMTLSDGKQTWKGTMSRENIRDCSRKVKLTVDEFIAETQKALTRERLGDSNFIYQAKTSGSELVFTWKKHIATDDIKFHLGSVTLEQEADNAAVTLAMFSLCLEQAAELKEQIKSLQSDNERLAAERKTLIMRMDKYVGVREELEKDLYNKFVVILNAKKEKLRALKEEPYLVWCLRPVILFAAGRRTTQDSSSNNNNANSKPSTSRQRRRSSDSEEQNSDQSDVNTDDEKPSQARKKRKTEEVDKEDDSLILDVAPSASLVANPRRRRVEAKRLITPAKPVIARVSSSTSKDSSRRSSVRKGSSSASMKSNDDVDDLINNF